MPEIVFVEECSGIGFQIIRLNSIFYCLEYEPLSPLSPLSPGGPTGPAVITQDKPATPFGPESPTIR